MIEAKESTLAYDYLGKIVQIGIVVENVQNSVDGMKRLFGLDPTIYQINNYINVWHKGEIVDAPMKVACFDLFDIQLEFIQPLGIKDTWKDYLEEGPHHGHSIHHIRFNVKDNNVASKMIQEAGIEKCMEGRSVLDPKAQFTYYDAREKLGFIIECVTDTTEK